jgi:rfaE bifunctional protein nucleotidyltransferase chain/domain
MPGPVLDLPRLLTVLTEARASQPGLRVVLTNGVFDLLHVGHLRSLRQARAEGDLLVVGVNADASVAAHKPGRPLVPAAERAELVAALEPVSYVVVFAEPTASQLIRAIRPAIYAKGADYTAERLPEARTAEEVGARLVLLPLLPGHSTSHLVRALAEQESPRPPGPLL